MSPQPKHVLNSYLTDSPQKVPPNDFSSKSPPPPHRPFQSHSQNPLQPDLLRYKTTSTLPPTTHQKFLTSLPYLQSRFSKSPKNPQLSPNNITHTQRISQQPLNSMLSLTHNDYLDYKDKDYILNMKNFYEKIPSKYPE
jgi:hypothetical protein